jgi:hypothetical protein
MVVVGAATNIFTGFVVDKIQVRTLVFVSAIICLVPPLLMALVKPEWGYWQGPFVAMPLSPLHPDGMYWPRSSFLSLSIFLSFSDYTVTSVNTFRIIERPSS